MHWTDKKIKYVRYVSLWFCTIVTLTHVAEMTLPPLTAAAQRRYCGARDGYAAKCGTKINNFCV